MLTVFSTGHEKYGKWLHSSIRNRFHYFCRRPVPDSALFIVYVLGPYIGKILFVDLCVKNINHSRGTVNSCYGTDYRLQPELSYR